MHPASREQPPLVSIEKWPHKKQTQHSKKKTKNKPKVFAFVSVGTTAPLESDVHFTHQRTQQEVEEKKILLWEFTNTKYLFSQNSHTWRASQTRWMVWLRLCPCDSSPGITLLILSHSSNFLLIAPHSPQSRDLSCATKIELWFRPESEIHAQNKCYTWLLPESKLSFFEINAFAIFNNFVDSFILAGVSDHCCLDFSPNWASRGYVPVAVFGLLISCGFPWVHGLQ